VTDSRRREKGVRILQVTQQGTAHIRHCHNTLAGLTAPDWTKLDIQRLWSYDLWRYTNTFIIISTTYEYDLLLRNLRYVHTYSVRTSSVNKKLSYRRKTARACTLCQLKEDCNRRMTFKVNDINAIRLDTCDFHSSTVTSLSCTVSDIWELNNAVASQPRIKRYAIAISKLVA